MRANMRLCRNCGGHPSGCPSCDGEGYVLDKEAQKIELKIQAGEEKEEEYD